MTRSLRGLYAVIGDEPEKSTLVEAPPDDGLHTAMQELFGASEPPEPEPINARLKRSAKGQQHSIIDRVSQTVSRLWNWARNVRLGENVGMQKGGWHYHLAGDEALDQVGFDLSSATPYLSAFASGFGGGGGDKKEDNAAMQRERERLERERQEAEKRSRNTLLAVVGVLAAAGIGTGIYFMARRK